MSNKYIERVIEDCKKNNPGEVEFHQTVEEVLHSLAPVVEKHPEYEANAILERLVEPERGITFKVTWVDDNGKIQCDFYSFKAYCQPYQNSDAGQAYYGEIELGNALHDCCIRTDEEHYKRAAYSRNDHCN